VDVSGSADDRKEKGREEKRREGEREEVCAYDEGTLLYEKVKNGGATLAQTKACLCQGDPGRHPN
jgi:hypothetical protein